MQCCESISEEPGAGNLHARFCGGGVTEGDPSTRSHWKSIVFVDSNSLVTYSTARTVRRRVHENLPLLGKALCA